jgi:hypothetical protein
MNCLHSKEKFSWGSAEDLLRQCLFFAGSQPIAKVKSLTHYGEPYDGNTRFFRSTLFVAAVRASYGESCLLHGVDWMPPKVLTCP